MIMKRFGLFSLSDKAFALPLARLVKIVQGVQLFRLPRLPFECVGVIVHRDLLVPVINPAVLLDNRDVVREFSTTYCVIVSTDVGCLALPADQVRQIVSEDKGQLGPVEGQGGQYMSEAFVYRGSSFNIIDIDYLVLDMLQGFKRATFEPMLRGGIND